MGKVICDVCGTAYAESVNQCPICGCVRSSAVQAAPAVTEDGEREHGSYTYVKGGRFSKANVKKRNQSSRYDTTETSERRRANRTRQSEKSNRGLVTTVVVLLLAIVAVVAYIVLRFFAPFSNLPNVEQPNSTPGIETSDTTPVEIFCDSIILSNSTITLEEKGLAALLDVTLNPADTTDIVTFASDDEAIATVNENGKITAVAAGETIIRVACGNATAECKVICDFAEVEVPTEPAVTEPVVTEPVATEPSVPEVEYKFNTVFLNEMTLKAGTTFGLRLQDPNKKSVEATFTSGNPSVCTVDADGTVHALAKGDTTVRAEFNGKVYKCRVIVN